MKLLFLRHGDPDYAIDSLTPTGRIEAELLAERIAPMPIAAYFVSPLGRAKATAKPTLEAANRTATECDWLREFEPHIVRPDTNGQKRVAWDWLPQDWLSDPRFLSPTDWRDNPFFSESGVGASYDAVTSAFDRLLSDYGYAREGLWYRVMRPNADTLAFFCHFGVSCVLLSHLMNVSPMVLWHGLAMAPTSVTTVVSEERRSGIASFRATAIGDVTHLLSHGREPSFSARFCEVYGDGTRED